MGIRQLMQGRGLPFRNVIQLIEHQRGSEGVMAYCGMLLDRRGEGGSACVGGPVGIGHQTHRDTVEGLWMWGGGLCGPGVVDCELRM